ncbi:MAG: molybdopterin-dependent oxidoreductase, partial [Bdellovibrionales bacterium]|nr:molybdopterin-dependent oxidoreductase [Bdellovibrionales bacterium]
MKKTKKSLQIINGAGPDQDGVSRRDFLKIMGAGATVTAVGCADSAQQNILPYVKGEPEQVPGVSVYYNSTCTECSAGCGIRVRTREGRAVMVEGNKESPINRGGLCAIGHSALQDMYDPDRVRQPLIKKEVNSKEQFVPLTWKEGVTEVAKTLIGKGKKALITNALSGAEASFAKAWCEQHNVEHVTYDPLQPVTLQAASKLVYGVDGIPEYKIDKADVVLNFGADYMETWLSPCGMSRDWAHSRKSKHPVRVIHIEPRRSLTAANADHWFNVKPGTENQVVLILAKLLLERGLGDHLSDSVRTGIEGLVKGLTLDGVAKSSGIASKDLLLAAQYLQEAKSSLVLGGGAAHNGEESLPLLVGVNLLNLLLGNVGKTVLLGAVRHADSSVSDLVQLLNNLKDEKAPYDVVMVYDTNPSFTAPVSLGFDFGLKLAAKVVSFSSHMDETTALADIVLPSHTGLESWGSSEPVTGVFALRQPVMTPVFETQGFADTLLAISKRIDKKSAIAQNESFFSYLQEDWKKVREQASQKEVSFNAFWQTSVERGGYFADYNGAERLKVSVDPAVFSLDFGTKSTKPGKDLILYPYASVKTFDGRAANRPWMQELPDPMTKVVWDTWAELNPKTAGKFGLKQGDSVALTNAAGQLNIPVHITEDVHEGIVAVPIGNGHSGYGRYAKQIDGGNVYDLLSVNDKAAGLSLVGSLVSVARGRKAVKLVRTQEFDSQMDRHIAQTEAITSEHAAHHGAHHEPPQAYEQRISPLYHWVMAVDLAACTGCSACVVACHAENNIPAVGKEVNYQGREM